MNQHFEQESGEEFASRVESTVINDANFKELSDKLVDSLVTNGIFKAYKKFYFETPDIDTLSVPELDVVAFMEKADKFEIEAGVIYQEVIDRVAEVTQNELHTRFGVPSSDA